MALLQHQLQRGLVAKHYNGACTTKPAPVNVHARSRFLCRSHQSSAGQTAVTSDSTSASVSVEAEVQSLTTTQQDLSGLQSTTREPIYVNTAISSTTETTGAARHGDNTAGSSSLGTSSTPHPPTPRARTLRAPQKPAAGSRPLIPTIDPQQLLKSIFGEPDSMPDFLSNLNDIRGTETGPMLYRPSVTTPISSPPADTLPVLVYLPGIDGTGLAAYRQFPGLLSKFDLRALFMPPEDRTEFGQLVQTVKALLERELAGISPSRPVYLLGESFGGLLALALAQACPFVDRVILVNPATSFADSVWPLAGPLLTSLPSQVYNTLPIALSPILTNPINIALHSVRPGTALPQQLSDAAWGLIDLLPELGSLRAVLPPQTLAFRLRLLQQGSQQVNALLRKVAQRVLLIVGENDLVIPSRTEAPRLKRQLQRCQVRVLEGRSHALLQEAGIDLAGILEEEGFYQPERRLTTSMTTSTKAARSALNRSQGGSSSSSDEAGSSTSGAARQDATAASYTTATTTTGSDDDLTSISADSSSESSQHQAPTTSTASTSTSTPSQQQQQQQQQLSLPPGGANFGKAAPLELPTRREVEKAMEEGGLKLLKQLVSPVYFSTSESGVIRQGLGAIPTTRPLLFVGNHQLFAPDMPMMIEEFLTEKEVLVRGLAHPFAMGLTQGEGEGGDGQGQMSFGSFLQTFGAVPVSARNLHKLLSQGEAVLLYPGGAREAFKLKNEKYKLIWPERSEFVRMAAKFGATIIPFAAVGAEDGVNLVLDAQEISQLPLVGDWLRSRAGNVPQARQGVNASESMMESFVQPLITFNAPHRFYFVFQQPIHTSPEMANDRAACEGTYQKVKQSVEDGLSYLQVKRETDPYKDLLPRMLFEATWGGKRQAPTFKP